MSGGISPDMTTWLSSVVRQYDIRSIPSTKGCARDSVSTNSRFLTSSRIFDSTVPDLYPPISLFPSLAHGTLVFVLPLELNFRIDTTSCDLQVIFILGEKVMWLKELAPICGPHDNTIDDICTSLELLCHDGLGTA